MAQPLSALPVGAKVKDIDTEYYDQPIIFQVAAKNHTGYPTNAVTLLTEKIITIKAFDAKEPSNSNADRKNYGNNRYLHSNILKWLNTNAQTWYEAQHSADAPPIDANLTNGNAYELEKGFLGNFHPDFVNAILTTSLTTVKNTATDGGGSEVVQSKVFLPSTTEVGLANENSIAEGSLWPLFTTAGASRLAYPTTEAVTNSTYKDATNLTPTKAWHWWLRTPSAGVSNVVRCVNSSGALHNILAYNGSIGVRPALNLPSDILVSDAPDGDGAYILQWNAPPTISGSDENLGNITTPFSRTFTVNDNDASDELTVTIKVNNAVIQTIADAQRGEQYVADLSSHWQYAPLNTTSTMTITVSDGKASSVRTYTFVRKDDRIKIRLKNPIETSIAAKRIVSIVRANVPTGATMTVKATNNALDASPVWEDITSKINTGAAHDFTNVTKTATKWGIDVEIEILKGTTTEICMLNAFGCSFE